MTEPFNGAKLAILVGAKIVTILRDDIPTIPWPAMWDLPGGQREGDETPAECALRETEEELGLRLSEDTLNHAFRSEGRYGTVWFFVAERPELDLGKVVFGDEGQEWRLVPIAWFLDNPKAIPALKNNLREYLEVR